MPMQTTILENSEAALEAAKQGKIRAYADNVIVVLEPLPETTANGLIHLPRNREERRIGSRRARVVAVGPGHVNRKGIFVPTEVKAGETVLVDALAGQDYSMDLNVPRHNKPAEWGDERGQFRIVREEEILCVVEDGPESKATLEPKGAAA